MLMAAILAILVLVAATAKAQTSQICTCTRISGYIYERFIARWLWLRDRLFLKPTAWSISPEYNYSISYTTTRGEHPSPVAGDLILPQSATPYLVVEWDPYWQIGSGAIVNATGQWNIWIVTNPSGNNPSFSPTPSPNLGSSYAGWDGIGTGTLNPNPGDRILMTVTYDPSTNILRGIAYDMSTEQSASFTLDLNGYFTPPTNGNYVFGVGAGTWFAYANWALLYVAVNSTVYPITHYLHRH